MRRLLIAGAALLLAPTVCLAAPNWTVIRADSTLRFDVTQAGGKVEGSFERFDTTIAFDPSDLASSHVRVSVDIASVTTGVAERDRELPKPEWFDLAQFPRATFAADRFRALGDNRFVADGTLTVRDRSVPVSLEFNLQFQGSEDAVMQGSVDLDRTTFGIGQGSWATSDLVSRKVTVHVQLHARRAV
jgi:polyisoprenoid-binding protein YceI